MLLSLFLCHALFADFSILLEFRFITLFSDERFNKLSFGGDHILIGFMLDVYILIYEYWFLPGKIKYSLKQPQKP